jgi:glyoxylase-like metal-dependent hydrolase (beta-lactamase superfamily II)
VPTFPDDVVSAVLTHMNTDHAADNLAIVRAFADPHAVSAAMTGLDDTGGTWAWDGGRELRLAWTATISERPEIRREIVHLYEEARTRLAGL